MKIPPNSGPPAQIGLYFVLQYLSTNKLSASDAGRRVPGMSSQPEESAPVPAPPSRPQISLNNVTETAASTAALIRAPFQLHAWQPLTSTHQEASGALRAHPCITLHAAQPSRRACTSRRGFLMALHPFPPALCAAECTTQQQLGAEKLHF